MNKQAKWIKAGADIGTVSPDFRRTFVCKKPVKRAIAYVSAMGVYNFYCNGEKVGDAVMEPGWTSYDHRVLYQKYDITDRLEKENRLSILVAKGWSSHLVDWAFQYAENVAAIADIRLDYEDGTCEHIYTDETWEVYTSHILNSEHYHGETADLTVEPVRVGKARIDRAKKPRLVLQAHEPVREHERFAASRLIITPKGERVIDFGQNLAGYVEIRIRGKRGDRVSISHAEVLDAAGNFYTDNLRTARQKNTYILSGGEDVLKPLFCFQGYRYIRLDEYPGEVDLSRFTSIALYSDMRRTGYFSCQNPDIEQLYSNALWGQRSNFVDLPTDCPQRNERLGWTGDAQVFCPTAAINYDVRRFFDKWLADMALEQRENGAVPDFIPSLHSYQYYQGDTSSSGWGDAAVIVPWELYRAYGDRDMLARHFPMMKKYVDYQHAAGEEEFLWLGSGERHYGDWLGMDAGEGSYVGATQKDFIASAYFAHSTSVLIRAGEALGMDMQEYRDLYRNIRAAFRRTFMKDGMPVVCPRGDGLSTDRKVLGVTQTSLCMLLAFDLCESSERGAIAKKLVSLIRANGGRMTTGFLGTPLILGALSDAGYIEEAYNLLLQTKAPSWLYSVRAGATTIWEHWDSRKEDGSFWSADMNSFNHYAYGAVVAWIFSVAVGIRQKEGSAGYSDVLIAPRPDRRLGGVEARLDTVRGPLSVSWRYTDSALRYEIRIPAGMHATLDIPGKKQTDVCGGEYVFLV